MNLALQRSLLAGMLSAAAFCTACGQGTFQNLNFEQANVPDVPAGEVGSSVSVSDGVPGWVVYLAGIQQSSMFHNDMSLGAAEVAIWGPQWYPDLIIEGRYTVSLQPSSAGPPRSAAIGQTGQIPQTAESLRFYGNGDYTVTFGGQPISLVSLGSTSTYAIFGGDITAFAGRTGELRFQGGGELDNILFSNIRVPEPGVVGLSALGALLLGWRGLRRRRWSFPGLLPRAGRIIWP